jgi:hypothetical protein
MQFSFRRVVIVDQNIVRLLESAAFNVVEPPRSFSSTPRDWHRSRLWEVKGELPLCLSRSSSSGGTFTPAVAKFLEQSAELRVSIVQNVTGVMQITPVLHGGVPGYLLHPIVVGVCGDPGNGDSPALQMKENST